MTWRRSPAAGPAWPPEPSLSKGPSFRRDRRLERDHYVSFVPESFLQTLFWVKDRKLCSTAQINVSRS